MIEPVEPSGVGVRAVHVDGGRAQARDLGLQALLAAVGDVPRVPDPAHADPGDAPHAVDGRESRASLLDHVGLDGLNEAPADVGGRAFEDHEDGDGDDELDDRVGEGEAEHHPDGADHHGERGSP